MRFFIYFNFKIVTFIFLSAVALRCRFVLETNDIYILTHLTRSNCVVNSFCKKRLTYIYNRYNIKFDKKFEKNYYLY